MASATFASRVISKAMESQSSSSLAKQPMGKQAATSPALRETSFVAEWNRPDWAAMGASVISGLLLGAGSYAVKGMEPPADYGNFLLLGGLGAAGYFAFRILSGKTIIYVGDAGVAVEQGGELTRLLWSEIESIRYDAEHLVLSGANTTLRIPSQSHTRAIRAVLAEAAERHPKILDVPAKVVERLPAVKGENPKPGPVASLQIAGKRCRATNQILTFERDARLCPHCASIYHRDHVPNACVTCERPLGNAALTIAG